MNYLLIKPTIFHSPVIHTSVDQTVADSRERSLTVSEGIDNTVAQCKVSLIGLITVWSKSGPYEWILYKKAYIM
jgi:hypothetical protein